MMKRRVGGLIISSKVFLLFSSAPPSHSQRYLMPQFLGFSASAWMSLPLVFCFRLRFQFPQVEWIGYHLLTNFLYSQILVSHLLFLISPVCSYAFMPLPLKHYYFAVILVEFCQGTGVIVCMNLLFSRSPELFSFPFFSQIPLPDHIYTFAFAALSPWCTVPLPLPHLINSYSLFQNYLSSTPFLPWSLPYPCSF